MKRTVEAYNEENIENGIGSEIKKKGVMRSVILPLILSLIAAIGIWTYVASEKTTITGLAIKVAGDEILLKNNYTMTIEPMSVDVVLSGKADVINQVLKDKSQITARLNVFKATQSAEDGEYYLFEDETKITPGTKPVWIEFKLPDGVTCVEQQVMVTVTPIATQTSQNTPEE